MCVIRQCESLRWGRSRDAVDSDAFRSQVLSESPGKADDCTFGGSIVDHLGSATESHNRCGIDDPDCNLVDTGHRNGCGDIRSSLFHVRQGIFRHRKHLDDVRLESRVYLIYRAEW